MNNVKPFNWNVCAVAALAFGLTGATASGYADEQATNAATPTVLTSREALQRMRGMAGHYRVAPTGEVFLYPRMKLAAEMYGMYGTYRVTSEGILLRPGGADGITMAESAMGGSSGTFRITPSGQAFFYSRPEQSREPAGKGATGSE